MKLYSIYFTGHYPVGAVAVVIASSEAEAVVKFREQLTKEQPLLAADLNNDEETLLMRCHQIVEPVTILLDGNY